MQFAFKKGVPRVLLRQQDGRTNRYPTIPRTGDAFRRGNQPIFFNDNDTIVFVSGTNTIISYPTTFPVSSSIIIANPLFTSSLSAPGNTIFDIDQFVSQTVQVEPLGPFKEFKLHEQDLKSTIYYQTGSTPETTNEFFQTNLGSKTKIRLEIPITQRVQLQPVSASVYYFNAAKGYFEEIGASTRHHVLPNGNYWETRLFNAFGNNIFTGSWQNILDLGGGNPNIPPEGQTRVNSFVRNNLSTALQQFDSSSVLTNAQFAATSSHLISLQGLINKPFMLEKMTVELPLITGPGWHGDFTNYTRISAFNLYRGDPFDQGGPAVMFSLLNQINATTRDMILSAAIIPQNDNFRSASFPIGPYSERFSQGFLSFGTPGYVVQGGSTNQWTGSIRMDMEPRVANGVTSIGFGTPPGGYQPNNGSTFANSFILSINPFGRGMKGKGSGRSVFGKEFVTPTKSGQSPLFQYFNDNGATTPGTNNVFLFDYEQSALAPYLLLPTDNLVFAMSKYRGCATGSSQTSTYNGQLPLIVANHDFSVNTGTLYVTLYGSLIDQNAEFHDTLNSRLDTNSVHETIGMDPVLDRWDVDYLEEFASGTLDNYLTGTLVVRDFFGTPISTGQRGLRASAVNQSVYDTFYDSNFYSRRTIKVREQISLFRAVQMDCLPELYYDSMLPPIDQILALDSAHPYVATVAGAQTGSANIWITMDFIDGVTNAVADLKWSKSFPFEPAYSTIARVPKHTKINGFKNPSSFFMSSQGNFLSFFPVDQNVVVEYMYPFPGGGYEIDIKCDFAQGSNFYAGGTAGGPIFSGLLYEDFVKNFYGTGNLNNCLRANGAVSGSTCAVEPRFITSSLPNIPHYGYTNARVGSICRGWKYGLINGLPQYTKAYFTRNRYGMIRDMLEQRPDTKIFLQQDPTQQNSQQATLTEGPVRVRFLNPLGVQVQPQQTVSSNLSIEATSSLPYFDGTVRNREDPLQFATIGSTILT